MHRRGLYLRQALSADSVTHIVADSAKYLQSDFELSVKTQWLVVKLRAMTRIVIMNPVDSGRASMSHILGEK